MHPSARARALALLLLAACPLAIQSQAITAVVLGRVVDESGAPVAAAMVTARHTGTGLTRTAATDASGSYRLPALPVGTYEVSVDKAGFARQVRPDMTLSVGQEATVDFSLRLASFSETLTVQGEAPIIETTKSALGTTVTTQQIDQLPLLDRDFTHLASLAPGIQRSSTEATDLSANGASGSSNTFLIDGMSIDQDALGDLRGDFSPDAIAEFQVLSSQYSAEFGQAAGAVINVVTRSGDNQLKGRLAGFYRADELASDDPFARVDPVTGTKEQTPFRQTVVSGFLAGPIRRDKAFFFASLEQTRRDETAVIGVDPAVLTALGQSSDRTAERPLREPRALAKVDLHATDAQILTLRYRLDRPTTENVGVGDALASGAVLTTEAGYRQVVENQDYAASHDWIASPQVLNEARLQLARQNTDVSRTNCPGCPTIIRPTVITGKLPNLPQTFREDRLQLVDAVSRDLPGRRGDHFFKLGFDVSRIRLKAFVAQTFDGVFVFATDRPFNAADRSTYPLLHQQGSGNPNIKLDNDIFALYLQDQWRLTPALTLNLGARWDYENHPAVKNDKDNLAPRAHFAWDVFGDGRTAVRGGFGIYYDQVLLNAPLIATLFEPGRFTIQTTLSPGFPDPHSGGVSLPLPTDLSVLDLDGKTPSNDVTSLGFARELAGDLALSVDAVHARGRHLLLLRDANAPIQGVRPDPTVGRKLAIEGRGRSRYEALQLGLIKRFSHRTSANLAYTYARSKNNTDSHRGFVSNSYDLEADWGFSQNDVRHTLSTALLVEGPWGLRLGFSGNFLSAPPYNIVTGLDTNQDGALNDRPPGVARNSARGEDLWTANVRLSKAIPLGRSSLEVIAEAFNVFDRESHGGFVGNQRSPQFGQPTGTVAGFEPRQIQLGLRLDF